MTRIGRVGVPNLVGGFILQSRQVGKDSVVIRVIRALRE
jgi:hypothetical protein